MIYRSRERRELRIFEKLLKLVTGLEERLLSDDSDEDSIMDIATMVSLLLQGDQISDFPFNSYRKVLQVRAPTIQKASRVL